MRAIRYHEHGGPDVLREDVVDRPEPGRDEVLIEVRGAGVNPVDTKFRDGAYQPAADLPLTPGGDVAGTVAAVGGGVDDYEPGDRVFGTNLGIDRQGACAEYALATTSHIATLPDSVDFEQGAAMGVVGVTAWVGLIDFAELSPGDWCLVHGGNGGVGHVAVQLAATAGARVITTARPAYHEPLRDLGAEAVLDYQRDDLAEAITDIGAPDVILDHMLDRHLQLDTDVGARGHRIVDISSEPAVSYENAGAGRGKWQRLHHLSMINHPNVSEPLGRLARLMETGDLVTEIARTYDLDEVADAHVDVLEESFLGKLVVVP